MNAVTLLLPYPPSTNRIWRYAKNRVYRSAEYKAWLAEGGEALRKQAHETYTYPVSIEFRVGRPDRRRRDLDNTIKPTLDLLEAGNVLADDCLMHRMLALWVDDVTGIQVDIYPMGAQ